MWRHTFAVCNGGVKAAVDFPWRATLHIQYQQPKYNERLYVITVAVLRRSSPRSCTTVSILTMPEAIETGRVDVLAVGHISSNDQRDLLLVHLLDGDL